MEQKKRDGVLEAVAQLKSKGVHGIKVELEAQMHRARSNGSREECDRCDGEGWWTCQQCDGENAVPHGVCDGEGCDAMECDDGDIPCHAPDCEDGNVRCPTCEGEGYIGAEGIDFSDEDNCLEWIMDKIASLTSTNYNSDDQSGYEVHSPFDWMSFARFYNDGSVDSELTFTIRLDNAENVFHLPMVLQAFRDLGHAMGTDFDVRGAGMHMALLFNSSCQYPSGRGMLLTRRRNMKRAVTQLLPALYFLAATDETTRPLSQYRCPRISMEYRNDLGTFSGHGPKYSAISYRDGAMEFRVFDTCYETPDAILDNVVVISNCLKFATLQYKSPEIDKITSVLRFGNDYGRELKRLYIEEAHIDVLNAGLKLLKPDYYTMKQIKAQRKFTVTKASVKDYDKNLEEQVETEYKEYEERIRWRTYAQRLAIQAERIRQRVTEGEPLSQLENIEAETEAIAEEEATHWRERNHVPKENYKAQRIRSIKEQNNGQYELRFV